MSATGFGSEEHATTGTLATTARLEFVKVVTPSLSSLFVKEK
jgi:hypothetical protein